MASNYNNAALFYDKLSRLVFGRQLINAQTFLLPLIPAGSTILIIGGGTGELISALSKIHASGLNITYVEISAKMIALAKKRNAAANQVTFINAAIECTRLSQCFDAIITAFFFDSLNQSILAETFQQIDFSLKTGGLWLNTDFQLTGNWWQKPLLKTMYLFFKMIGCVDTFTLMDMHHHFIHNGYHPISQKNFFGAFIFTKAYKKQPGKSG